MFPLFVYVARFIVTKRGRSYIFISLKIDDCNDETGQDVCVRFDYRLNKGTVSTTSNNLSTYMYTYAYVDGKRKRIATTKQSLKSTTKGKWTNAEYTFNVNCGESYYVSIYTIFHSRVTRKSWRSNSFLFFVCFF